ncbi:hypothetical protein LCGC14_2467650 [marine sediment metagenome]|uniref:Uncharacterized protein n=1 Tax=marine sediment metagenome TaxID=412755 RepID=A0A0F9BZ56_9ZZZZ
MLTGAGQRPGGAIIVVDPGSNDVRPQTIEHDWFKCWHCQTVVIVEPFAPASEMGGWCGQCARCICGSCADEMGRTLKCKPFEQRLDEQEARDRLLTAV